MELRQGCAGQRVEGLRAVLAAIPLQAALLTPTPDVLGTAMAASRIGTKTCVDQFYRLIDRQLALQRRDQRLALHCRQITQLRHKSLKSLSFHASLPSVESHSQDCSTSRLNRAGSGSGSFSANNL